jgi:glycosyltransferase involved in cell wall biosynthesis
MKTLSLAFGEGASQELDMPVRYLFSREYKRMLEAREGQGQICFVSTSKGVPGMIFDTLAHLLTLGRELRHIFELAPPAVLFFSNPHPLNWYLASLARAMSPGCVVICHIHEPIVHGFHSFWINQYSRLVDLVQRATIRRAHAVIVSSERALGAFQRRYASYPGHVAYVPLLYQDFQCREDLDRKYVTYIGRVSEGRGIGRFIDFLRHATARDLPFRFQIVTRDRLDIYLNQLTAKELERLYVINREHISDAEVSKALRESVACCVLYDFEMMQSGVPPVAFMNGTPVIATPVAGLLEIVRNEQNGVIATSLRPNPAELADAVLTVQENFGRMSSTCREDFEKYFSYKAWGRYYAWLVSRFARLSSNASAVATNRSVREGK